MTSNTFSPIFGKTVKQLAIEKGIYRQRGRKTSSASSSPSSPALTATPSPATSPCSSKSGIRFLIVIDFESTCWEDPTTERFARNIVPDPQEIIEFPAVLVDLRTGHIDISNSFHVYVQPEERPTLSAFCTRLTGITQDRVESGVPLRICLPKFIAWMKEQRRRHSFYFAHELDDQDDVGEFCSAATWTDWDLGRMLRSECERKGLRHPPELGAWIDLKAIYSRFYGRKPAGLAGALKDAGMTFEGREHSGIDDAVNTAKLAARMARDGCVMRQTKSLPGITLSAIPRVK